MAALKDDEMTEILKKLLKETLNNEKDEAKAAAIKAFNEYKETSNDENLAKLNEAEINYYITISDLISNIPENEIGFHQHVLGKLKGSDVSLDELKSLVASKKNGKNPEAPSSTETTPVEAVTEPVETPSTEVAPETAAPETTPVVETPSTEVETTTPVETTEPVETAAPVNKGQTGGAKKKGRSITPIGKRIDISLKKSKSSKKSKSPKKSRKSKA